MISSLSLVRPHSATAAEGQTKSSSPRASRRKRITSVRAACRIAPPGIAAVISCHQSVGRHPPIQVRYRASRHGDVTRWQERREAHAQEDALRAQRRELESDLTQIAALIEVEAVRWADRRSTVRSLGQEVQDDATADAARIAWYTAAYEDAQHALVMSQTLFQRYNDVARALSSCQRELMQVSRDHRRG